VDWDGVGTFALFLASGGVIGGVIALKGYQAKLASKLELARLERMGLDVADDQTDQILQLEAKVDQLAERLDFTEKLLGDGAGKTGPEGDP
jgi:hypothetical protein